MSLFGKSKYLMESSDEFDRLEGKFDESTAIAQLRLAGAPMSCRFLDVGSGSGAMVRLALRELECATAVGVDANPERINAAEKFQKNDRCKFVVANASNMPFPNASFDFVWSRFLFEYLPKPMEALVEMHRVVSHGGTVCVADLDMNCEIIYPFPLDLKAGWTTLLNAAEREYGFDRYVGRKLYQYFIQTGFSDISVTFDYHHKIVGKLTESEFHNWYLKVETARRLGSASEQLMDPSSLDAICDGMLNHLRRTDLIIFSPLIVVSGKKR